MSERSDGGDAAKVYAVVEMEQECNGEKRLADTVLFANRDNALKYLRERYDAARREANSGSGEFDEFASDYSEDGWYAVVDADGDLKEGYLSDGMEVRSAKPRTTEIALSLIVKVRDGVLAIKESHAKPATGHDILVAHNCDDLLLRIDAVRRMVEGGAV